ncbi:potassium channel family protein [Actinoplanes sp. NPDC049548]|uniref:potassium channel family protein n=1 Tax=Actinoplanes sp. NPDC049548 TaxID=3155152 RepID=UPI003438E4E2
MTRRRRLVAAGLTRALATTVVLVALYYLLPLDRLSHVPSGEVFAGGLLLLLATAGWQVRAVITSANPAIRAIEGAAATAPLFVLLFAATYYVLALAHPGSFNVPALSRTDTLYFAVTVFSTVGFGDITATSPLTRSVVTLQMVLDLVVLGLGVRVFVGAVRLGRGRNAERPGGAPGDD